MLTDHSQRKCRVVQADLTPLLQHFSPTAGLWTQPLSHRATAHYQGKLFLPWWDLLGPCSVEFLNFFTGGTEIVLTIRK